MRGLIAATVVLSILTLPFGASAEQPWITEVRTGKAGVSGVSLEAVCKKLAEVNPYHKDKISREVAIPLAKELLDVLATPWQMRELHYRKSESRGVCLDGNVEVQNGNTVMDALIRVLEIGGAQPKDIGQTPASLRQILLKDLKAGIVAVRKLYKDGYGGHSNFFTPYISDLAGTGIKEWHFKVQELELTKEEADIARTITR